MIKFNSISLRVCAWGSGLPLRVPCRNHSICARDQKKNTRRNYFLRSLREMVLPCERIVESARWRRGFHNHKSFRYDGELKWQSTSGDCLLKIERFGKIRCGVSWFYGQRRGFPNATLKALSGEEYILRNWKKQPRS